MQERRGDNICKAFSVIPSIKVLSPHYYYHVFHSLIQVIVGLLIRLSVHFQHSLPVPSKGWAAYSAQLPSFPVPRILLPPFPRGDFPAAWTRTGSPVCAVAQPGPPREHVLPPLPLPLLPTQLQAIVSLESSLALPQLSAPSSWCPHNLVHSVPSEGGTHSAQSLAMDGRTSARGRV